MQRLLDDVDRSVLGDAELTDARREIDGLFDAFQQDQIRNSQARDYRMLYHHYLRLGQVERAWQFRIKASETLASTGDRALFQRQSDVIAVLYNSNFAMQRAREYLDRAGSIFTEQGVEDSLAQTHALAERIY